MMNTVRYFALGEKTRRELQASSIDEALPLLQTSEILSSERTPSIDEQIRHHARTVIQYRNLHRSAMGEIRRRRVLGSLTPKSLVLLLGDAAAYRRLFASHRRQLERALHIAAMASCNEAHCTECRMDVA